MFCHCLGREEKPLLSLKRRNNDEKGENLWKYCKFQYWKCCKHQHSKLIRVWGYTMRSGVQKLFLLDFNYFAIDNSLQGELEKCVQPGSLVKAIIFLFSTFEIPLEKLSKSLFPWIFCLLWFFVFCLFCHVLAIFLWAWLTIVGKNQLIDWRIGSVGSVWAEIWRSRGGIHWYLKTLLCCLLIDTSTDTYLLIFLLCFIHFFEYFRKLDLSNLVVLL